ncbi:hypothetical protein M3C58_08085 [Brachybacterium muris]|uniref:Lipoprotein n=2 Tax=Brachybacterium TaxID=43668 RepID=A0A022L023_9MICO|nr:MULTISPECIES: hypothetical protein [Brachybacterium]EYT49038.1 hypothetical protein D641_0110150 [Brachybacterium muris UCD-AY4]MBE9403271.1 hypothetical protein [Brachybacterium epidermidis]MBM7502430.1 D-alanyl-D-alanine dipeptidase [Brachybacterium muris]MCT1384670.1 hypothetical protein [Brachybacterium sp. p3-SID1565]MCT1429421.1 hypothetical protein [Brachybacterium muris]
MAGLLGTLLAACGVNRGPDDATVTAALQQAVEGSEHYVVGSIRYLSSFSRGTAIDGALTLRAADHDELLTAYDDVLQRLSAAYRELSPKDPAQVAVIARAEADRGLSAAAEDVVPPASAGHPDTDDLAAHYGT